MYYGLTRGRCVVDLSSARIFPLDLGDAEVEALVPDFAAEFLGFLPDFRIRVSVKYKLGYAIPVPKVQKSQTAEVSAYADPAT